MQGGDMRSTITLDEAVLSQLIRETGAKTKAAAVKVAIDEFIRRRKVEGIVSKAGTMEFDRTADEIRHAKR